MGLVFIRLPGSGLGTWPGLYYYISITAPCRHHGCGHHLCGSILWQVKLLSLALLSKLLDFDERRNESKWSLCATPSLSSFAGLPSKVTTSTGRRRKTLWSRWTASPTSSSRCSTPPASTTPLQAPSTSRRTSTGTERPSGLIVVVDPLKYKTSNVRLMRKRDKSQVKIYKLFGKSLQRSRFYFLRKIQNCVLSFKASTYLVSWCYL